jgi:hypothetical protein
MDGLKRVEWHGGTSAHGHQQRARPSQRELVTASLLRTGEPRSRRRDDSDASRRDR